MTYSPKSGVYNSPQNRRPPPPLPWPIGPWKDKKANFSLLNAPPHLLSSYVHLISGVQGWFARIKQDLLFFSFIKDKLINTKHRSEFLERNLRLMNNIQVQCCNVDNLPGTLGICVIDFLLVAILRSTITICRFWFAAFSRKLVHSLGYKPFKNILGNWSSQRCYLGWIQLKLMHPDDKRLIRMSKEILWFWLLHGFFFFFFSLWLAGNGLLSAWFTANDISEPKPTVTVTSPLRRISNKYEEMKKE